MNLSAISERREVVKGSNCSASLSKKNGYAETYANHSYCEYVTGRFAESIKDIDQAFILGMVNYNLLNLRDDNFRRLGKMESACRDFQKAMNKGDASAAINYRKYCNKK